MSAVRRVSALVAVVMLLAVGMTLPAVATEDQDLVQLINAERVANGLAPLAVYWDLTDDALAHSEYMAATSTLRHNTGLGSVTTDWITLQENVGAAGDIETVHQAMLDSPSHLANILGDFNYIGVGVVDTGPAVWVTEVFMLGPAGLSGIEPNENAFNPDSGIYEMVFPSLGDNHYSDTWGACRGTGCSRTHEGIDIMADKMLPVVAVADGTVGWQHDELGGNCCAMALNHDDGWASWYIHMNNDTPGTDDGLGWGFAPGITSGVHVRAGQLLGWVGDSGNAENSGSHTHFELHEPDGTKTNPYPHLIEATVLETPVVDTDLRGCDFNGDLHDDAVIGVPGEDVGLIEGAGGLTVLYSRPSGLTAEGSKTWTQNSLGVTNEAEAGDEFGAAVACGDFDGDGVDDLAVGVPGEDLGLAVDAGAVAVFYGSFAGLQPGGIDFFHQDLAGVVQIAETGDRFGQALAAADYNDDGFVDLAVGVPGETLGSAESAGSVAVIYGSLAGLATAGNVAISQSTSGVPGATEGDDRFGAALAAGDFDGDGDQDLAVGTEGEDIGAKVDAGAVTVLVGGTGGLTGVRSYALHQSLAGISGVAEAGDRFGASLAAGDFDGDGDDDLAIGVPGEALGAIDDAGVIVVVYGHGAGLDPTDSRAFHQDSPGVLGLAEAGDLFGAALAVGDFDSDGHDDLAIGIPGEDIGAIVDAGAAGVLFGRASGLSAIRDQAWSQNSAGVLGVAEAGDGFGSWLATADLGGAGFSSLLIGVPSEDIGELADAGALNLLPGTFGGVTSGPDQAWSQSTAGVHGVGEAGDYFGVVG